MKLSEQTDYVNQHLYRRRQRLPFILLPLGSVAALLLARPFGLIGDSPLFLAIVLLFILAGVALRWYTLGYTPVSPGITPDSTPAGSYSLVRNPLELADLLLFLGAILSLGSWAFLAFAGLLLIYFYLQVITVKETLLEAKYGEAFTAWCLHSTALLPRRKSWVRPHTPFSFRSAAYGTASRLLWVSLFLVGVNLLRNRIILYSWEYTPSVMYSGAGLLILYISCLLLGRKDKVIH